VKRYEEASRGYAVCRYLETLGSGVEHPQVASTRELHDAFCRAVADDLPLA